MVAEAAELERVAGGSVAYCVFQWLVPQYVVAARKQLEHAPTHEGAWKVLRQMLADVAPMRREGHRAARLALARERLAFDRARERWK